jgi:hypothetical protein
MKYEKPEAVLVAPACAVIEAKAKGSSKVYDMFPEETVGAYEADE